MNPNNWLRCKQPGFAELSDDERNAIRDFVLLWSLFEARVLDSRASAQAIANAARRWSDHGRLGRDKFQVEQTYVRNRYCPDGEISCHFGHLNFRGADKELLVRKFLRKECQHAWEDAAGLLIIVYRWRNNLFHGLKWPYDIRGQGGNFSSANAALMQAIDLDSYPRD